MSRASRLAARCRHRPTSVESCACSRAIADATGPPPARRCLDPLDAALQTLPLVPLDVHDLKLRRDKPQHEGAFDQLHQLPLVQVVRLQFEELHLEVERRNVLGKRHQRDLHERALDLAPHLEQRGEGVVLIRATVKHLVIVQTLHRLDAVQVVPVDAAEEHGVVRHVGHERGDGQREEAGEGRPHSFAVKKIAHLHEEVDVHDNVRELNHGERPHDEPDLVAQGLALVRAEPLASRTDRALQRRGPLALDQLARSLLRGGLLGLEQPMCRLRLGLGAPGADKERLVRVLLGALELVLQLPDRRGGGAELPVAKDDDALGICDRFGISLHAVRIARRSVAARSVTAVRPSTGPPTGEREVSRGWS